MQQRFTYSKNEKLKSRKLLQKLFNDGKQFVIFPLKVFYFHPDEALNFSVKAGFGASSHTFKKAVQRNRIKRLLREAYRTQKLPLYNYISERNKQLVFFVLYIDKTMPEFSIIKTKMNSALQKLMHELNEDIPSNT